MNRNSILSVLLAAAFALAPAAANPTQPALVRPDGLRAYEHIKVLAAEEMRGRKSGNPEYMKAAEYVAARMKEYGLKPGGENGTYFQTVPFKSFSDFVPPTRLDILSPQKRSYVPGRGRDFNPVSGTGSGAARGALAFAGYGVVDAKSGWDDYARIDPKGKILILMPDAPAGLDDEARRVWTLAKKVRTAAEKGAAGLIEMDLAEPGQPVVRMGGSLLAPGACPPDFVVLRAGRNFCDDVFYMVRSSWRDLVSKTLRLKSSHTAELGVAAEIEAHFVREERSAVNVLGVIPGNDPKLKAETIIMGGHLDHLGVALDGFVYPGADDNAGSVACTLETARTLIASGFKPARTLVFASWAGEEVGAVGSRYYVEHPTFPLGKTALYLNIDMVGNGDSDLYVGGMFEYGSLFEICKAALDEPTRAKLRPRLNYRGSDHSTFWDKGVASISLRTGNILTNALDDEHPEYHRPGDLGSLVDPELLRLSSQYHYDILRSLAATRVNLLDPRFRAEFVHKDAAVVDLHCDTIGRVLAGEDLRQDLPKGHIDIPKLKRGAVDLQVFACFVAPPANDAEKTQAAKKAFDQIDACLKLVADNPEDLVLVRSAGEFSRTSNSGKTAILMGIEGGYAIENDLSLLRAFYQAGVRLMTLTHWTRTDWADASGDPEPRFGGLTDFGESVVREMNRLGMVVDVSHAHDETFWDVLRVTKAPVVASHSCCRALSDHFRNLSDDMLKALAKNGGMVGINFYPAFLNAENDRRQSALLADVARKYGLPAAYDDILKAEAGVRDKCLAEYKARLAELRKTLPPVDVKTVVDHIDHAVKVMGSADGVGLGSDFDGISETPAGLENAGKLDAITRELLARGYKEADVRKILGGNFSRVLRAVEQAAAK
jgi:membrane dipeptidase